MRTRSCRNGATIGTLAGMALALVFLSVIGWLLVRPSDSSFAALIAIWLWALPALGLFGSAGWLLGKGVDEVNLRRHRSRRHA